MCSPRWLQTKTPSTVIKRFHLVLAIVDVEVASKRLAECLSLALEAAVRRVLGERRLWAACDRHGAMGGLWGQLQSESGRQPLPRCHSDKFDYQQMDTHIGSRNPATPGPSDIAQSRFIRAEVFASLTP